MGRDISTLGSLRIELRLAGTFGVIRDGVELTEGELGSRKSRTLLKLLAVERPGLVPVDRIIDVLWAADPRRPPSRTSPPWSAGFAGYWVPASSWAAGGVTGSPAPRRSASTSIRPPGTASTRSGS